MERVCIIVPVYNVEKYLHRCIDSIMGQTFQTFELVLVDDGSTDNGGLICDEYAEKNENIIVIHQSNGGLSAARNSGLDWYYNNSHCEWITFIDSDDWIHPRYLEIMHGAVKKDNSHMAICNYLLMEQYEVPNIIESETNSECKLSEDAYIDRNIATMPAWCKLYHRSLWENMRFPTGKLHEDAFTTHIAIFNSKHVSCVYERLYYYFYNSQSIMHKEWSPKRLEEFSARDQRLLYIKENDYQKAYQVELNSYLWMCVEQLNSIPVTAYNKHYRCFVKKKLRQTLKLVKGISLYQRIYFNHVINPTVFRYPLIVAGIIEKRRRK